MDKLNVVSGQTICRATYRGRRLLIDHLRILNFYGKKGCAPRSWVKAEMRAHTLWVQALDILSPQWIESGYLLNEDAKKWEMAAREYAAINPYGQISSDMELSGQDKASAPQNDAGYDLAMLAALNKNPHNSEVRGFIK